MYIKLIQPKMNKRPMDTDIKIRMSPPLGLYAIANLLGTAHKVTVENENIQRIVYDDGKRPSKHTYKAANSFDIIYLRNWLFDFYMILEYLKTMA